MPTRKKEGKAAVNSVAETELEEALSFEEAISEVEDIVDAMEGDQVPLDALLRSYERGTLLVEHCRRRIDQAQARIDLITERQDGRLAAEAFDPAAQPEAAPAKAPAKKTRRTKKSVDTLAPTGGEKEIDGNSDEIRLF